MFSRVPQMLLVENNQVTMKTPGCVLNLCDLFICSDPTNQKHLKPLSKWSRLACLYSSPQVKFYLNIVSYFAFLFLFAVVLMIDFQETPSAGEFLLYIWLFSLVCEEVRQVRSTGVLASLIFQHFSKFKISVSGLY